MTGKIVMTCVENGITMDVQVRDVDKVDLMMAMHALKTSLKMPEALWKEYVVLEQMGLLEPHSLISMPGDLRTILEELKNIGGEGVEG